MYRFNLNSSTMGDTYPAGMLPAWLQLPR